MSTFVQKENSGSLFKNSKKTDDKHPDYTGSLMVGNTEMQIAGWVKQGKTGSFLALKISEKRNTPKPSAASVESNDDLPF